MLRKSSMFIHATLICSLFLISLAGPAKADTTYTYQGNQFTFFLKATCPPQCSLSGSFTLATPLADNLVSGFFIPESFSFTDGSVTITNLNATFFTFDHVSTNAQGVITDWNMSWQTSTYSMFSSTDPPGCTGCSVIDVTFNSGVTIETAVDNNPGVWTSETTAAPEPSSLFLLGTGLIGALGLIRRRLA